MKASIIIVSLLICCYVNSVDAQETVTRKMINSTSVTLISDPSLHNYGALYQIKDSSVLISHSKWLKDYTKGNSNFNVSEIEIIDIQIIKILSKTKARKGALIGAASGFAVMGGITMILNELEGGSSWISFPSWQVGLANGIVFAPVGAFFGAIIGSFSVKIPINGSMDNYNRNKDRLKEYSLKN